MALPDVATVSHSPTWVPAEADAMRRLCHDLVRRLPDSALADAVESLTSDLEMHAARLAPAGLTPETRGRPAQAKLARTQTAPVAPIEEVD